MSAITFESRDAWLAARRKYVTSTDIPIILGLKSYKSVIRLWAEKLGLLEPKDFSGAEWAVVGLCQEETVRKLYAHYTQRPINPSPPWTLYVCDQYPKLAASIDHIASDGARSPGGIIIREEFPVEGKAQESWKLDEWEDERGGPTPFVWQLHTQMLCRGDRMGSLCAIIGNKFRWWDHQADEATRNEILRVAKVFMGYVERQEMPPVDSSKDCSAALIELQPHADKGKSVELGHDGRVFAHELAEVKASIKALQVKERHLRNQLLVKMGDAFAGKYEGELVCTVIETKAAKYTTHRRAGKSLRLIGEQEE